MLPYSSVATYILMEFVVVHTATVGGLVDNLVDDISVSHHADQLELAVIRSGASMHNLIRFEDSDVDLPVRQFHTCLEVESKALVCSNVA